MVVNGSLQFHLLKFFIFFSLCVHI